MWPTSVATTSAVRRLPRLALATLAENAVKHGIAKQKEGGLIHIKIVQAGDLIKISVQNPGEFNPAPEHEGLGLKNLQERLMLQYKGKAGFAIINRGGNTVMATITIQPA